MKRKLRGPRAGALITALPLGVVALAAVMLLQPEASADGGKPAKASRAPAQTLELVKIPAGSFAMGAWTAKPGYWKGDEAPVHGVNLPDFWIAKYEVTAAQWADFLNKVGGWMAWHPRQPIARKDGLFVPAGDPKQAVSAVNWAEAEAFCRWHGLVLPTEAQWERAARGPAQGLGGDGGPKRYPWGDEAPDCARANVASGSAGCHDEARPVGSHPGGVSAEGVHDLAGNVAEWVRDWYGNYGPDEVDAPVGPKPGTHPYGDNKVLRGGSFIGVADRARTTAREMAPVLSRSRDHGFRCGKEL